MGNPSLNRLRATPIRTFWSRLAVVLALCLLPACASVEVPPPGSAEEQRAIEQGRQADRQIRRQFGVYEDEELQAYVSDIGQRLAAESEWPSLPGLCTVRDSPSVNTFAVRGGCI